MSRLRVRSEHCIGELKGRFQCLRGLRVSINSYEDHLHALRWITVAIILHNLVIDVKARVDGAVEVQQGAVADVEPHVREYDKESGEEKRKYLIAELLCARYGEDLWRE